MTYTPSWTQADSAGLLTAGEHVLRHSDLSDLLDAINRRRKLAYLEEASLPLPPRGSSLPITTLRDELLALLSLPSYSQHNTTYRLEWLWPIADEDENKIIVNRSPSADQINLRGGVLGQTQWTDPSLAGGDDIRATHINELRRCIQHLRRGRWNLPIVLTAGILDILPDTTWGGWNIASSATLNLHSVGFAELQDLAASIGLIDVTVRSSSRIEITPDYPCELSVYRCKREIDFSNDSPTWNHYAPSAGLTWESPGANGSADAEWIATESASADTPCVFTGSAIASAIQTMLDGEPQNIMVRRNDTGPNSIALIPQIIVEFDLNSPPT